jgi:hypothetical protein
MGDEEDEGDREDKQYFTSPPTPPARSTVLVGDVDIPEFLAMPYS